MNKLTAEKCREQFEAWAINHCAYDLAYSDTTKQSYRSMKTKAAWKVWQAYRAALPILEQQERGEGEWIEWGGDECPVDGGVIVETRWSDGDIILNRARAFGWHQSQHAVNIIAYRIIPERATNQNGEQ